MASSSQQADGRVSSERSPCKTALVDSSLLVELQKGPSTATAVKEGLREYRFISASSYSKREIKRSWLQALGYLYKEAKHVDSVLQLQERIARKLAGHEVQRRRLTTCTEAMMNYLDSQQAKRLSDAIQVARFRAHCKRSVLQFWHAWETMVGYTFRGTGCVRAEEPPRERPNDHLDVTVSPCSRADVHCCVHEFYVKHDAVFRAIARAVEAEPNPSAQLARYPETIEESRNDPRHLCDDKNCSAISDAIIAVDGATMDTFAANNDAEWGLLARVLGKPLVNPVRRVVSREQEE